jgi:hypothetical protein
LIVTPRNHRMINFLEDARWIAGSRRCRGGPIWRNRSSLRKTAKRSIGLASPLLQPPQHFFELLEVAVLNM